MEFGCRTRRRAQLRLVRRRFRTMFHSVTCVSAVSYLNVLKDLAIQHTWIIYHSHIQNVHSPSGIMHRLVWPAREYAERRDRYYYSSDPSLSIEHHSTIHIASGLLIYLLVKALSKNTILSNQSHSEISLRIKWALRSFEQKTTLSHYPILSHRSETTR